MKRNGVVAVAAAIVAAVAMTATAAIARGERIRWQVTLKGPVIRVRLAIPQHPVTLTVTLNGHTITRLFSTRASRAPAVALGRGDGLRPGRNVLRAAVLFPSGNQARVTATFRLGTNRILPDASSDRTVYAGDRVRLSALGSTMTGRGPSGLTVRWRIVRRPARSRARLRQARSARPLLLTDRPGVYRIEVMIGSRARRRVTPRGDVVQVDAVDGRTTRAGVFVSTIPLRSSGPATALRIYSGSSAGTYALANGQSHVTTLLLDRKTLEPLAGTPIHTGVGAGDVTTLQRDVSAAISSSGRTPLIIEAGNNYGTMSSAFVRWLHGTLGATGIASGASSFSLAGVVPDFYTLGSQVVANVNSVSPDVGGASRLSGQLVRDAQDNWVFTASSVPAFGTTVGPQIRFDTSNNGAIVVGGKSYPAATQPAGCQGRGGYELLALAASGPNALQPLQISEYNLLFNRTFTNGETFFINACGAGGKLDGNRALEDAVGFKQVIDAIGSQPAIIFIQSVGDPRAPSFLTNNSSVFTAGFGSQIRRFGGTPAAFLGLLDGNQTKTDGPFYAFAGQNFQLPGQPYIYSPAEVSTDGPDKRAARLVGVLVKDGNGDYIPNISTAANTHLASSLDSPLLLSHLAAEVDPSNGYVPDRFPHQGNPAWEAALVHAGHILGISYQPGTFACYRPPNGISDVRSNYCGGVPVGASVSHYWESLYGSCGTNPGCLQNAPYKPNSAYSASVWSAVKAQLATEFRLVDETNQVAHALKQTLTPAMVSDTNTIAQALIAKFKALQTARLLNGGTSGLSWGADILNLLCALSGFVTDSLTNVLWSVSAGLTVGADAVNDASGTPLLSGPLPGTAAGSLSSQMANQVSAANLLVDKYRDAVVSDWQRLQGIPADHARLPNSESVDASVQGARLANIKYTWQTLMDSVWKLDHQLDNGGIVNPPGTSIQDFQCWGSGGLQRPYKSFAFPEIHYQYDGGSYALTYLTPSPASSEPHPAPPGSIPQLAPTSLLNGFFADQPQPGTPLNPVVGKNLPPGLGIDSHLFYSRLIAIANGTGQTRQIDCNGGGS